MSKKLDKLNIGNAIGTFQPEFISGLIQKSEHIQKIDTGSVDASIEIQEARTELLEFRKILKEVDKFINQDIVVLTGKTIEAKRKASFDQTAIDIFSFVGKKAEEDIKELENK